MKKTWNFKDVVDPKTRTFAVSWPKIRNKSSLKVGVYVFSTFLLGGCKKHGSF